MIFASELPLPLQIEKGGMASRPSCPLQRLVAAEAAVTLMHLIDLLLGLGLVAVRRLLRHGLTDAEHRNDRHDKRRLHVEAGKLKTSHFLFSDFSWLVAEILNARRQHASVQKQKVLEGNWMPADDIDGCRC
jgi:hypothetical protein